MDLKMHLNFVVNYALLLLNTLRIVKFSLTQLRNVKTMPLYIGFTVPYFDILSVKGQTKTASSFFNSRIKPATRDERLNRTNRMT